MKRFQTDRNNRRGTEGSNSSPSTARTQQCSRQLTWNPIFSLFPFPPLFNIFLSLSLSLSLFLLFFFFFSKIIFTFIFFSTIFPASFYSIWKKINNEINFIIGLNEAELSSMDGLGKEAAARGQWSEWWFAPAIPAGWVLKRGSRGRIREPAQPAGRGWGEGGGGGEAVSVETAAPKMKTSNNNNKERKREGAEEEEEEEEEEGEGELTKKPNEREYNKKWVKREREKKGKKRRKEKKEG